MAFDSVAVCPKVNQLVFDCKTGCHQPVNQLVFDCVTGCPKVNQLILNSITGYTKVNQCFISEAKSVAAKYGSKFIEVSALLNPQHRRPTGGTPQADPTQEGVEGGAGGAMGSGSPAAGGGGGWGEGGVLRGEGDRGDDTGETEETVSCSCDNLLVL